MNYSEEEVYELVGKQDKTANVTFKSDSESFRLYGPNVTVVFVYTQYEREGLDERIKNPANKTGGKVKVRHLVSDLNKERIAMLEKQGINTEDILSIIYFKHDEKNTFHSEKTRTITKLNIPVRTQRKGRDYDWMYGFSKKMVTEGIGLSPKERAFYLAGKFYYEPNELTETEREEIFSDLGKMNHDVEWEHLSIRYQREETNDNDIKKLGELINAKERDNLSLMDKYLKETGSSLSKLAKEDIETATRLYIRIDRYKERHFNVVGEIPIYLDVDRYLHVHMRHVEEMKVNKQFENKSNFQWKEEDVLMVIEKVIDAINDEIQDYFKKYPERRYSRYGKQSVYFEGDYYTLHIEPSGSISTFHRTWKAFEQTSSLL